MTESLYKPGLISCIIRRMKDRRQAAPNTRCQSHHEWVTPSEGTDRGVYEGKGDRGDNGPLQSLALTVKIHRLLPFCLPFLLPEACLRLLV